MNKTGQIVLIGFLVFYILFWGTLIFLAVPKEQRSHKQSRFDERQQLEQGRAFRHAYLTLILYLVGYLILEDLCGLVWCETLFGLMLGLSCSVCVFLAYCVFQDAYFQVGESKPAALIGVNAIGLAQLFLAIETIAEGTLLENGIVTGDGVHLLFFGVILMLDIFVFIRKRLDQAA